MNPKDFNKFFNLLADQLTVTLIARKSTEQSSCFRVNDDMPIFEALELLEKHKCLATEEGLVVTRKDIMKKPVKTLFYALIIEIDYRLYKILKNRVESIDELQTKNMNDMIRLFLTDDDLFKRQTLYKRKTDLKKDLKALNSFRNVIMHSNRKLYLETEFRTILNRKRQALKLLEALGQLYTE